MDILGVFYQTRGDMKERALTALRVFYRQAGFLSWDIRAEEDYERATFAPILDRGAAAS